MLYLSETNSMVVNIFVSVEDDSADNFNNKINYTADPGGAFSQIDIVNI